MEMMGLDSEVLEQLYKLCSTRLCANTLGQVHRWKGGGGGGRGEKRGREMEQAERELDALILEVTMDAFMFVRGCLTILDYV